MNLASIAHQAADLIDRLSTEYGEEANIRTTMVLVEVELSEGNSKFVAVSSEDRPWAQLAYLDEHRYEIEGQRDEAEEKAADEGEDD